MLEIGPVVVATARGIAQEIEMTAHAEVRSMAALPADTEVGVEA